MFTDRALQHTDSVSGDLLLTVETLIKQSCKGFVFTGPLGIQILPLSGTQDYISTKIIQTHTRTQTHLHTHFKTKKIQLKNEVLSEVIHKRWF